MNRNLLLSALIFLIIIGVVSYFPLPPLDNIYYMNTLVKNSKIISSILMVIILFLITYILGSGILLRRYSFKIEKLTLGGVNILLDNSDKLFIRSVKNHLDGKRTLFKICFDIDNFDETLNSYFETYKFIRDESKILNLNRIKERKLYELSNEIIKRLNNFLTANQNDFRRWYKYVSEKDLVYQFIDGKYNESNPLIFHQTTISLIQKQYYRYDDITNGFQDVNKYFCENIKIKLGINTEKWGI